MNDVIFDEHIYYIETGITSPDSCLLYADLEMAEFFVYNGTDCLLGHRNRPSLNVTLLQTGFSLVYWHEGEQHTGKRQ